MLNLETLTNSEKKVLLFLKDFDNVTSDVILEKLGINEGELNKAIEWLKEKKIINVDETLLECFEATELGKRYANEGLPENRFLKAIEKNPLPLQEAKKVAKLDQNEFDVAIGILKKNNLVEIKDKKVFITDAGKNVLSSQISEKFLQKLSRKKYVDEIEKKEKALIPFLEPRALISRSIEKIRRITLQESIKNQITDIKIEDSINVLTSKIIISKAWKNKKFRRYNLDAPSPPLVIGKKHPYLRFIDELKQKLISMGFKEMSGPVVEFSFFNNEALYMPQDHPAREIHDVYHLKNPKYGNLSKYKEILDKVATVHENGGETGSKGWGYKFNRKMSSELLLRSHTTAVSGRKLSSISLEIPGKYFSIGRTFRVDEIDWKHLSEFYQFEGIVIDPKLTFKELLGMLKMAAIEIGNCDKFKFAPGYFPFTEPSVELHAYMKGKGWVEIGGAGIFRPELTVPLLGKDIPVLAWGLGILRLFMLKYNIDDMRQVFSQNLKWLREFKW